MRNFLLLALVWLCTLGLHAQQNMYVIKDHKVVAVYNLNEVDSLTFELPNGMLGETYPINCLSDRYAVLSAPESAVAGQTVTAYARVNSPKYRVDGLKVNGQDARYVSDDGLTWRYSFTMPAEEANLELVTNLDRHTITPVADKHAYLTMLNCCDDWSVPEDQRKFNEMLEGVVKFYWGADDGYIAHIKATSESGEDLEVQYTDKDPDLGKCYFVIMPDEPITIHVTATERTAYKGQPFTGDYTGYAIAPNAQHLVKSAQPTLTLHLDGNTAYTLATTDDNQLTAHGTYTYNEKTQRFAYVQPDTDQKYGNKGYGVNGFWLGNGDAFVNISNLDNDKPDNERLYFASQRPFSYACATTDDYGMHYLIELTREGEAKAWYYIDTQTRGVRPVTLQFTKGTSIGEACQALALDADGQILFSYTLTSADATPAFKQRGSEAGTYTLEGGSSSDRQLTLDGFGGATYGQQSGSYTLSNSLVAFTGNDGSKTSFKINSENHTYTLVASAQWDGPKQFMGMTNDARYNDQPTMGTLTIVLDSNAAGKEAPGKAKVQVVLIDNEYQQQETNSSTCSYSYDASQQTLLISGLLVGKADGTGSERIDLLLNVSADKRTLTCPTDTYIRATAGGNTRYLPLKGLEIKARD